jgi:hypothetical protein
MCGCVCNVCMCGCFGNTCTCIYRVLYCLYCVLYCFVYVDLFLFVLSVLVQGLLPPSDYSIAVIIIIIIIIIIICTTFRKLTLLLSSFKNIMKHTIFGRAGKDRTETEINCHK